MRHDGLDRFHKTDPHLPQKDLSRNLFFDTCAYESIFLEAAIKQRGVDRIVFGTDLLPEISMYRLYYRFLETADEYFEYPTHASRQGRWNIYGLYLPDDVLLKIYRENALRLLGGK